MKIKLADIPLNIIDGIDKHPKYAIGVFAFLLGSMSVAIWNADSLVFGVACAGVVGALAAFWKLGKPK